MIASEAAKLVSKFISESYPSAKSKIYEILEIGINKAWSEGKWIGMTADGYAQVYKNRYNQSYFFAPVSHPILLAVNIDGRPTSIRGKEFVFHRNGNGDMRSHKGCEWNTDVTDFGEVPYEDKLNINFDDGVLVGVRSIGPAGPNEAIVIGGTYIDGKKVFTYTDSNFGKPNACSCTDTTQTVNGIKINITPQFNYIDNITFSQITSIEKTPTRSLIEVIVIDSFNNAVSLTTMEPGQTVSKFRKYIAPNTACHNGYIHGLFKIAKQEAIVNDYDQLIITDKEALICLTMGINALYYKNQVELGSQFIIQGLTILEKIKRETESPSEYPIQVDVDLTALPATLQNFH